MNSALQKRRYKSEIVVKCSCKSIANVIIKCKYLTGRLTSARKMYTSRYIDRHPFARFYDGRWRFVVFTRLASATHARRRRRIEIHRPQINRLSRFRV